MIALLTAVAFTTIQSLTAFSVIASSQRTTVTLSHFRGTTGPPEFEVLCHPHSRDRKTVQHSVSAKTPCATYLPREVDKVRWLSPEMRFSSPVPGSPLRAEAA